jgi:hypothetical protein
MEQNSLEEPSYVDGYFEIAKLIKKKKINMYGLILFYICLTIITLIAV